MTRSQSAYYFAFICASLLCLSPSKAAAYLAPVLAIAVYGLMANSATTMRRLGYVFVGFAVYACLFGLFSEEFRFQNALTAVLTYSSFAVIAVIPSRGLAGAELMRKMMRMASALLFIEAAVGLVQALVQFSVSRTFDFGNGDIVQGTINPTLSADSTFSNPMFAVNVAMLILCLWFTGGKRTTSRSVILVLGSTALVLAAVVHVVLMAGVAVFLGSLFGMTGRKALIHVARVAVMLVLAMTVIIEIMPQNLSLLTFYANSFESGSNVRAKMVQRAVLEMPRDYAQLPFVGLGLGQFNSRAAMISTGRYFGSPGFAAANYPLPITELSSAQNSYFMDLWLASNADKYVSSTVKPFFSWLSIYTELGSVGIIAVVLVFSMILREIWRHRSKNPRLAIGVASGCLLFAALGLQENYWEVPQAVLVGMMLLKLLHANLVADMPYRPGLASGAARFAIRQMKTPASSVRRPVPHLAPAILKRQPENA